MPTGPLDDLEVLHRHGLSRRANSPRQSYRRYEWSRPGALLHVDTSRLAAFAAELERVGARQIFTPPYTPRWNGKVERFFQTLKREWAHAHTWPSSSTRSRALPSFLRYYNRRRPHSSLADRPPISRVHNVRGQDN